MKEALWWEPLEQKKVRCGLCPHACQISPGKHGICRVRKNIDGKLVSLNYGHVASLGLDPIEKKPLFHFHPGSLVFSLGTYGCNLSCQFCQNWQLSQTTPSYTELTPKQVSHMCSVYKKKHEQVIGVAYTYNEPTVWYEFIEESAQAVKDKGLSNVLVTNGYISKEPLRHLLPFVDAMNVDIKAWDDRFYKRIAGGRLRPVLETVEAACEARVWVEVTYLVVPGENDNDEDIGQLTSWLKGVDENIVLHLSRYFPAYNFDRPPTPLATLERLGDLARENLDHVYIGNAWKKGYSDTVCPNCGEMLLERGALELEKVNLENGACQNCSQALKFRGKVWV